MTAIQANNEKVAAVVILFHPDQELFSRIASYSDHVDCVYVYDNTEKPSVVFDPSTHPKVVYHHDGENKGLPIRLNAAVLEARADGFNWLLTMDQDTHFSAEHIKRYFKCFEQFEGKAQVASFGPEHSLSHFNAGQPDCTSLDVERIITSGSLLNLDICSDLGGFDEALFIDSVDWDFCIRARLSGYRIVMLPAVFIEHNLGAEYNRASIKTLFLVKKKKRLHSPLRCYYIQRNLLYLEKKFEGENVPTLREIRKEVERAFINNFYYGRDTVNLFRYLALARKHFREGKMGKLTKPL